MIYVEKANKIPGTSVKLHKVFDIGRKDFNNIGFLKHYRR